MTKEQKLRIEELRKAGMGYKQIANETGVSLNNVKSYCRRNELQSNNLQNSDIKSICVQCGEPMVHIPKKKQKRFCSDDCRRRWWNAHPDQVKRGTIHSIVCPGCGKEFSVYGNPNRKYCSHSCYVRVRYGGACNE